jgi:hypothetical protein
MVSDEPATILLDQNHRKASRIRNRLTVADGGEVIEPRARYHCVIDDDRAPIYEHYFGSASWESREIGPNRVRALGNRRTHRAEKHRIRAVKATDAPVGEGHYSTCVLQTRTHVQLHYWGCFASMSTNRMRQGCVPRLIHA